MQQIVDCLQGLTPILDTFFRSEDPPGTGIDRLRLLDLPLFKSMGWEVDDPRRVNVAGLLNPRTRSVWFQDAVGVDVRLTAKNSNGPGYVSAAVTFWDPPPQPNFDPGKPYIDALAAELTMHGFTAWIAILGSTYTVYALDRDRGFKRFFQVDLTHDPQRVAPYLTGITAYAVSGGHFIQACRDWVDQQQAVAAFTSFFSDPASHRAIAKSANLATQTVREIMGTGKARLEFPPIFPIPLPLVEAPALAPAAPALAPVAEESQALGSSVPAETQSITQERPSPLSSLKA